jgi:hypothetical protein
MLLRTMLAGPNDTIIAIRPKSVTGVRLVPDPVARSDSADLPSHPLRMKRKTST